MCIRIELITPDPCEARAFTSDKGATFTTINQPQILLAGVAEPTENASRLIADVQLDGGFPLEPGVVGSGLEPTGDVRFAGLWWLVGRPFGQDWPLMSVWLSWFYHPLAIGFDGF